MIWVCKYLNRVAASDCACIILYGGNIRTELFHVLCDNFKRGPSKNDLVYRGENCSHVRIQQWAMTISACFLSFTRWKLRLCSANHRPGYLKNLPCDWPSTAWAYSEQETENRPRFPLRWGYKYWHRDKSKPQNHHHWLHLNDKAAVFFLHNSLSHCINIACCMHSSNATDDNLNRLWLREYSFLTLY